MLNRFRIDSLSSNLRDKTTHLSMQHCFHVVFYIKRTILAYYASWKWQVLQKLYLTVIIQIIIKCGAHAQNSKSLDLYFCCFWINVTQINFKNIKRKIQRIISDSCFQLKSWFNVDARAPPIPLLNFPFKIIPVNYVIICHIQLPSKLAIKI